MKKISWANAVIIVGLLAVACVALLAHDTDIANVILGAVIGTILGTGATTVVVARNNGDPTPPPAVPPAAPAPEVPKP